MDPKKDYYIKIKFFNNGEKTFYGQNLFGAKDYTGVPFTYIELVPENIYAGNRHEDWW